MPPYENDDSALAGLFSLSIDDDEEDVNAPSHPQPLPLTGVKVEVRAIH